jgi:hypothetical protein
MKTKITPKTTVIAAGLLAISSIASAQVLSDPVPVPSIYNSGPAAPLLNMTNMREAERVAFALGEALLQATEAVVYVKGCQAFEVDVDVYSHPASNTHFIQDTAFGGIRLDAFPRNPITGFGQNIDVAQFIQARINGTQVQSVRGRYAYSGFNNLMVNEKTGIQVKGQLRTFDQFYSSVIKDFYHGGTYNTFGSVDPFGDFYVLYDYGLQSLSKFGYPVNKWWQKSKAVRDDGQQGCTVFQKDRLVGAGACRITLATTGLSQPGLFWQSGTLKVSTDLPNTNEVELNSCNINPIFLDNGDIE